MLAGRLDSGIPADCLIWRAEHEEGLVEGPRMPLVAGDVDSVLLRLPAIADAGLLRVSDSGIGPLLFLRIAGTRAKAEKLAI